jgi:hypothetical protein
LVYFFPLTAVKSYEYGFPIWASSFVVAMPTFLWNQLYFFSYRLSGQICRIKRKVCIVLQTLLCMYFKDYCYYVLGLLCWTVATRCIELNRYVPCIFSGHAAKHRIC